MLVVLVASGTLRLITETVTQFLFQVLCEDLTQVEILSSTSASRPCILFMVCEF